jgi:hypothetical protein
VKTVQPGGDERDLLDLRHVPGDDAVQILPHPDMAEPGSGIGGMLGFVP